LTISVAVDGRYNILKDGTQEYVPRTPEELQNIEDIIKNSVGYDLARGDQISVSAVQFDNEFLRKEQVEMQKREQWDRWRQLLNMSWEPLSQFLFIFFLRYLAKTVSEAMNPPVRHWSSLI
jgi:flagellar M-ring protein FliF